MLKIILINALVTLIILILDKYLKPHKIYLNIFKMKVNVINKNTAWHDQANQINENTKYVELDFILQIYNHSNTNNSIYDLDLLKKQKHKLVLIENHHLNLTDSMKSITGSTTYQKIKFINLLAYEVKELKLKIKLTKAEFENLKKEPLYLQYKNKHHTKKLKINNYLKK